MLTDTSQKQFAHAFDLTFRRSGKHRLRRRSPDAGSADL